MAVVLWVGQQGLGASAIGSNHWWLTRHPVQNEAVSIFEGKLQYKRIHIGLHQSQKGRAAKEVKRGLFHADGHKRCRIRTVAEGDEAQA
jgi:hypothetical protein